MRICDLTLDHVRKGGVWWVPHQDEELIDQQLPMEQLTIAEQDEDDLDSLTDGDRVAYIGIAVTSDGEVRPLVMIRELGPTNWGDSCEYVNGTWRQVGLEPEPDRDFGESYFASPLPHDPGFDSDENDSHRNNLRQGFQKWVTRL